MVPHLQMGTPYLLCLLLPIFLVSFPGVLVETVSEDAVRCLRGIKHSLKDPQSNLAKWIFSNSSDGRYICRFEGVSCWNDRESRLLELRLRRLGLSGTFPQSLKYCGSLLTLDLSGNDLSGFIPDICSWLPYLASIDLSDNMFYGPIPPDLANCGYLNKLNLANNSLSGNIPYQFSSMRRLKEFSVADNDLKGSIPFELNQYGMGAFQGNSGLCGWPLGKCPVLSEKSLTIIIAAAGFGAGFSLLLSC
ncbi:hypothetical protein QQ045_022209 [Rhodiola kirilowii]